MDSRTPIPTGLGASAPPDEPGGLPYKWRAFGAVAVGIVMAVLDANVVNVALPTIADVMYTDLTTVRWVVMAYSLSIAGLLLSMGRLSDLIGRKRVCLYGYLVFTVASGLCGLAGSVEQLIAFRVLQGVGAAMLMAVSTAIVTSVFPSSERGKALGVFAVVVAGTSTVGPTIGGLLVDLIDWRSAFYFRVPIGIAGIVLVQMILQEGQPPKTNERFDYPGAAVLTLAVTTLVLALGSEGTSYSLSLLAASLIGAAVFVIIQTRTQSPLIDLAVFRNRLFTAASLSSLLSFMASFAVVIMMPFYLEQVLGYRPFEVGALLVAQPLAIVLVAPLSGRLSDRIGSRVLSSAGIAIVCLGLLSLAQLGEQSDQFEVLVRLALVGLGQGLFQSPNNSAIMGSVPTRMLGFASSMLSAMRTLGGVVGTAVATTVFASRLTLYSMDADPSAAFVTALHDTFLVSAAIASIGVAASLVRGRTY